MSTIRYKSVTFETLERALADLGFVRGYTTGRHKVFKHEESDTVFLFRESAPQDIVGAIQVLGTRRILIEKGLVDEDEFDELLEQAQRTTAQEQEQQQRVPSPLSPAHP